jgi:ABC-type branched-subunit amino acid transport system permease subunit
VLRLSNFTGGEDGRNFRLPEALSPGFRLFEGDILGIAITGKVLAYYLVLVCSVVLFLAMLRIVNCASAASSRRSARTNSGPRRSAIGRCTTA